MAGLLTPEVARSILESIARCNTQAGAATKAGVSLPTFKSWIAKGTAEGAKEPYKSFAHDVRVAEEEAKEALLLNVMGAKDKNGCHPWQASMELLTKRYWQEFGKVQQIQMEVQEAMEKLVEGVSARMSREAVVEFLEALAAIQGMDADEIVEARAAPAANGNGATKH